MKDTSCEEGKQLKYCTSHPTILFLFYFDDAGNIIPHQLNRILSFFLTLSQQLGILRSDFD